MSETAPEANEYPELAALLDQYRATPDDRDHWERLGLLTTAISQVAPWRIMVFDGNGDAVKIDASDTPEEVLKKRAWQDMRGMVEALAVVAEQMEPLERRPVH